jgi:hypothetical protein
MPPKFKLISQFTEDAFAADDHICKCLSCQARILKGDPCFYVGTVDPGKSGRYVCGQCHAHYLIMPATSVRPTGILSPVSPYHMMTDMRSFLQEPVLD